MWCPRAQRVACAIRARALRVLQAAPRAEIVLPGAESCTCAKSSGVEGCMMTSIINRIVHVPAHGASQPDSWATAQLTFFLLDSAATPCTRCKRLVKHTILDAVEKNTMRVHTPRAVGCRFPKLVELTQGNTGRVSGKRESDTIGQRVCEYMPRRTTAGTEKRTRIRQGSMVENVVTQQLCGAQ